MTTFLFMPSQCFEHDTGYGHPESAERLRAIDNILGAEAFSFLVRAVSGPATREQLERAHDASYISKILAYDGCDEPVELDEDTVISGGSVQAALYSAGAACQAVNEVMSGRARNAFCAIRPPGHHAERALAMGFCLFNNAAIAALEARVAYGVKRVAVVDFDVHHGNGIQSIAWNDPDLLYISLHEEGGYPQSGLKRETGVAENVLNVPLHSGAGSVELRDAWRHEVEPRLRRFAPELVIISAGFDAHQRDLMGGLCYTTADYGWMTAELCTLADGCCQGRVVSLLEGGYDLPSLAASVGTHVRMLLEL